MPAELEQTLVAAVPRIHVMAGLAVGHGPELPVRHAENGRGESERIPYGRLPTMDQLPAVPNGKSVPLVDVVALNGPVSLNDRRRRIFSRGYARPGDQEHERKDEGVEEEPWLHAASSGRFTWKSAFWAVYAFRTFSAWTRPC